MLNNKFIRDKKKFNPDIASKLEDKDNERKNMKVTLQNNIYNPITNIIPPKIFSQNDLLIKQDPMKIDIKNRMMERENERTKQDQQFKPIQNKIISDNLPTGLPNNLSNSLQNNEINNFVDLKKNTTKETTNKNKYNSVIDNLKELGIL